MTVEEAEAYHRPQVAALAAAGADRVTALTMTHAEEAAGVVRAATRPGCPWSCLHGGDRRPPALGRRPGRGHRRRRRRSPTAPPAHGHQLRPPRPRRAALAALGDLGRPGRRSGANASRQSHAELDAATELDDGDPAELGDQVAALRRRHPHLQVLGGCCGTDARHLREIARAVTA